MRGYRPRGASQMAAYYCYECLRKPNRRQVKLSTKCPACKCELRRVKNVRTRAQVVTRLARHRGIKPPNRKTEYQKYCASDEWKVIRDRVLERDSHTCQDCGKRAITVHHLSYRPEVMAGEDDSQLVSLCVPCHESRHPEHRKRRKRKRRKSLASG